MKLPTDAVLPDYAGGGILNLMASIGQTLGAETEWPTASELNPDDLGRRQVLLIIDGLGFSHLHRVSPDGFLADHCRARLTSVVPSATASAVPVFMTGDPPSRHGFTGWFNWFRELSLTAAILPYAARAGFTLLKNTPLSPIDLSGSKPFADKVNVPVWHVAPERIASSRFNRDFAGCATILPYRDFRQLEKQVLRSVRQFKPDGFVYAYWPEYDHLAHQFGVNSVEADQHLLDLEQCIETLVERLKGQGVDLLICADHGFTDCPPENQFLFIEHFPELAALTRFSLTGEPRLGFAYLQHGATDDFLQAAEEQLQNIATAIPSEELLDQRIFGPGQYTNQVPDRIGDVCLFMHSHKVIFDALPGETPPRLLGHHGGLSAEEMYVPLIHYLA